MRSWKYYGKDNSWKLEIKKFFENIYKNKNSESGLENAITNLKLISLAYKKKVLSYDYNTQPT